MMPDPTNQPAPPLQHALYLAALGYRVIPIRPGSKHPPVAAWQDAATNDADIITAWWNGLYRNHGIGILTGNMADGTRFFALDIDDTDAKSGSESLADLVAEHGELPDTITSHTGSGGRHMLLKVPPGVECPRNDQSGHLAPGIDVRGEGGQIVVAPTVHPNGREYVWEHGHGPGEIEMAVAPWWLVGLLEKRGPTPAPKPPQAPVSRVSDPFTTALDDGPAQRYNDRNDWATMLQGDGWTLSHTSSDGEQHWIRPGKTKREGTSATVGYKGNDALKVFTSSVPWLQADTAYSRFGYMAARDHGGDRSTAARAILDAEGCSTAPLPVIPVGTAPEASYEAVELPDGDAALLAMLVDWPTFWAKDATDAEWLAEPILAVGRAHAIYAPGGTGKSLFSLWLAAQLATGGAGLSGEHLTPKRVLYLDYEMTHDDVQERLESMGFHAGTTFTNLHYALLPSLAPADQPEGGKQIARLAQLVDAELVVLDTFSRAVEGDENDADTVRSFYRWTGLHLKAEGRAFVRIDHAGKDIDKGQRGTSAKNDDVDVVWQMVKADNGFALTAKKRRMGWVPETVALQQHDEPTLHYSIARENVPAGTAEMVKLLDDFDIPIDASYRKAGAALRTPERSISNHVLRAALKARRERGMSFTGGVDGAQNASKVRQTEVGARNLLPQSQQGPAHLAHSTKPLVDDLAQSLAHPGAVGDASGGARVSLRAASRARVAAQRTQREPRNDRNHR